MLERLAEAGCDKGSEKEKEMKWFTSDWHLGHENVMRFSDRPFGSINEMNEKIINNMLEACQPGDELFFLGDLAWRRYAFDAFFERWPKNVNFHWILGNHDKNWQPFKKQCASIGDMKKTKIGDNNVVIMCHYPMLTWDRSHYNSWQLFGHHHQQSHGTAELDKMTNGKMLNVNLEWNDFKPYSETDIIRIMRTKPDNWDLIKKGQ